MFKYLKKYRFTITLFLFLLIPIIAIDTSTRAPRDYRFYDRALVAIMWPIQSAITWTLETGVNAFHNYVYLLKTREENSTLLVENQKLLSTILNLKEAEEENNRLRNLLNFKEQFNFSTVVARVIAKDVSTEFRSIRINRGEDDGIRKDMAVVNAEGVVGRVYRTTPSTSDVVTILDLLSSVDSVVKRSRVRGIVSGKTDEICELRFALRTDDINVGDLLISSGLGGIFPKGVAVGTVSEVEKLSYGISQTVEVRPSVSFAKLEEVLVITQASAAPAHVNTLSKQGKP